MPEDSKIQEAAQPPLGCLLRLFWMMFGNVALLFAAMNVASSDGLGLADAVYAAVVMALLLARSVDIVKLHGLTTDATPATRGDLRRYAVSLLAVALAGWLIARGVSMAG